MECQHGPAECRLNRVINCAQALRPAQAQWLPFVLCLQRARAKRMEAAVESCAAGTALDAAALHACAAGPQGDALEHAAAARTNALVPPHT